MLYQNQESYVTILLKSNSTDGLERASAKASELRTEFMRNLWDIATIDGSVSKLCERFDGEEKARCMNVIDEVLLNKK